jgi:hypothetical protein
LEKRVRFLELLVRIREIEGSGPQLFQQPQPENATFALEPGSRSMQFLLKGFRVPEG